MKYFSLLLESDPKRVKNVEENLLSKIPDLEIFPAIEGDTNQLEFFLEEREIGDNYLQFCKRGEIACLLSHLEIWKKMVREDISEAVILEDDAYISDSFLEDFGKIYSELPKNYDFLYLFIHPFCFRTLKTSPEEYSNSLYKGFPTFGFVGYCITKKLILEILPYFYKIATPIDEFLKWFFINNKREYFCVKENLVNTRGNIFHHHKNKTELGSNIGESKGFLESVPKMTFYFDDGDYLCYPCCDIKGELFLDPEHTLSNSKRRYLDDPEVKAFNSQGNIKGDLDEWVINPKVSLYVKKRF